MGTVQAALALLRKLAGKGEGAHRPWGPGAGATPWTHSTRSELGLASEGGKGEKKAKLKKSVVQLLAFTMMGGFHQCNQDHRLHQQDFLEEGRS